MGRTVFGVDYASRVGRDCYVELCGPMHSLLIVTTWTQGTSQLKARLVSTEESVFVSLGPLYLSLNRHRDRSAICLPARQHPSQLTTTMSPHALLRTFQYHESASSLHPHHNLPLPLPHRLHPPLPLPNINPIPLHKRHAPRLLHLQHLSLQRDSALHMYQPRLG